MNGSKVMHHQGAISRRSLIQRSASCIYVTSLDTNVSEEMSSNSVAKVVVFDIRNAKERDPLFLWASQALYETTLLAFASQSSCFSSLSIALVGSKGFDILASQLSIVDLDFSFQKLITKLKQQLKIPPMNAIYPHRGSFDYFLSEMLGQFQNREINELNVSIWTRSEKEKLTEEMNGFLERSRCSMLFNLNMKVEVIHLSYLTVPLLETNVEKVTWRTIRQEPEVFDHFKDWLKVKHQNWIIEAADNEQWSITVDVQDIAVDLSKWKSSQASKTQMKTVNIFSSNEARHLQMTDYIRSDALPAFYLFGIGREVTPSRGAIDANATKFRGLVNHLRKESWLAIARLLPPGKGTDLFVLIPSCFGNKLLMRNLVPRELISPFPDVPLSSEDADNEDEFDVIERESFRAKVLEACKSLPMFEELPNEQDSILKAVSKKLQDNALFALGTGNKSVTPLKMRKPNVKFVYQ